MSKLAELRTDLGSLRRKRRQVRWWTAFAGLAAAVVWILAAAFALDFRIEGSTAFRAALLAAIAALVAWAWQRLARPWLAPRETDLDMALLAEQQCRARGEPLGQDLVAALQFESPQASSWGSVALEREVVADVAVKCRDLDVLAGISTAVLARRLTLLTATLLVAAAAVTLFPEHALAFANRMLLGNMHYPTATRLDAIVINGREIPPAIGRDPVAVVCPEGESLAIEVRASGDLPIGGRVDLRIGGDREATVELMPVVEPSELANRHWTVYTGRLGRLTDTARYQVYLGDAWTDPATIELVPLPVVDCRVTVTPPEYAKAAADAKPQIETPGARSVEALEGSQVRLEVVCRNKPLASAEVTLGDKTYQLARVDSEGRRWRLAAAGTPLAALDREVSYKVAARDTDGLSPERAAEGTIRLKLDRPPRITARAKTKYVLPTGRPVIEFRVADDYGVARVAAKATVLREGPAGAERLARSPLSVELGGTPVHAAAPERRTFAVPLAALDLAKGDRLEVVLEVTDHRGDRPGRSVASDPLVFHVTDAYGVETAVTELDPALEQQIHSLIQKHLDIGASK